MLQFDTNDKKGAVIKVVGIGGGGCNAMGTGLFAALMFAVSAMVYRRR